MQTISIKIPDPNGILKFWRMCPLHLLKPELTRNLAQADSDSYLFQISAQM